MKQRKHKKMEFDESNFGIDADTETMLEGKEINDKKS